MSLFALKFDKIAVFTPKCDDYFEQLVIDATLFQN